MYVVVMERRGWILEIKRRKSIWIKDYLGPIPWLPGQ